MTNINRDEVEGKLKKGKGWVKDKAGEVTGNRELEAEGEAERVEGETQDTWGKVKRNVNDAVDSVGEAISNATNSSKR